MFKLFLSEDCITCKHVFIVSGTYTPKTDKDFLTSWEKITWLTGSLTSTEGKVFSLGSFDMASVAAEFKLQHLLRNHIITHYTDIRVMYSVEL